MQNAESLSPAQIRAFLQANQEIDFTGQSRAEVYAWVQRTLVSQEYGSQNKPAKGILRAYVSKVTGLSRAQTTRLIGGYLETGQVKAQPYRRRRFASKYTAGDIALLAQVDRAHERLSGPATQCILKREYEEYGKAEFERLAEISVGHLYNLRSSARYRKQAGDSSPRVRPRFRSASGAGPSRRAGPGFCAWTRCIRATGTGPKACITSMR